MSTPWFTVKEVKPHIFGIAEFAHEEEVISYLIVGRTHALLIDSGLGARPIRPIVESITSLPIVLTHTHHHWDHIGGDHEFSNKIDAQSVMSIDCEPFHFRILTCPGHSPDSIALLMSSIWQRV
jgi:glyoxylase-like metal-dependent hydrolase (beta-lactamase superfamily II)